MHIAIIGTRGIPNEYGGFEQFVEELGVRLAEAGHEVRVFNPEDHSFNADLFKGVKITRQKRTIKFSPALSSLIYDCHCLRSAIKIKPDIILSCGYSSALFLKFAWNKAHIPVLIHMDGMEWQRQKWGFFAKIFLKWNEKLAIKLADGNIIDHPEVGNYYIKRYKAYTHYIPFGAETEKLKIAEHEELNKILGFELESNNYYLLISRLEPENNVEMILDAYKALEQDNIFLVIGSTDTKYGKYLLKKFGSCNKIIFTGSIFRKTILNALRANCKAYFHGHSVGGTNPSLIEAMAASCLIFAHDNIFNRHVLGDNAYYFSNKDVLSDNLRSIAEKIGKKEEFARANIQKIKESYNWDRLTEQYIELFRLYT